MSGVLKKKAESHGEEKRSGWKLKEEERCK